MLGNGRLRLHAGAHPVLGEWLPII